LQCAERLHRTVQNFLLYGQLEMRSTDSQSLAALREQKTDQVQLHIEKSVCHLATKASRSSDLQLDLAEGTVIVASDLFTKLVEELIDNAFKFSAPGTVVRVVGKLEGAHYILAISDHGRGMGEEQIAQIGAYAQFDRQNREQQGSGLGLTIARRI